MAVSECVDLFVCGLQLSAQKFCTACFLPFSTERNTCAFLTLVDFQLDAQNSYLFTYNTCIKILYMFRALPCSSSGGLRHNCVCAASGIVTLCS